MTKANATDTVVLLESMHVSAGRKRGSGGSLYDTLRALISKWSTDAGKTKGVAEGVPSRADCRVSAGAYWLHPHEAEEHCGGAVL